LCFFIYLYIFIFTFTIVTIPVKSFYGKKLLGIELGFLRSINICFGINKKNIAIINDKIIDACKQNDRQAQEIVYRYFFPKLLPMIRKYTGDESEIISIFNDGMLRVFSQLETFQAKGNFDSWVKIIVKNSLSNYFRKYSNRVLVSEISENTQMTKSNILSGMYYQDLLKVLKKLPARSSEVFRLYAIEGYSHKEISEKLGITVGTSKWHLFKAKEKLSDIIELNHEKYE